ncbi:hypothetical protein J4462_03465 [Candidatus Pacearchaeota archaeon]|nr:hypothetical protein [Candidatus Pacearchaeota archaeon]
MFGKKEERGLPDLPPLQSAFPWKQEREESHALPSFPDSPISKGFSQTAIRDAVGDADDDLPLLPESEDVKVVEMKEWNPISPSEDLPEIPQRNIQQLPMLKPRETNVANQMKMREIPYVQEMPMRSQMRFPEMPTEMPPQIQMPEMPMRPQIQMPEMYMQEMRSARMTKPTGVDVFVKIDKFHSAKKTLRDVGNSLEEIDSLIKKIREVKLREEQEISSWEKDVIFEKIG